MKTKPLVSQAVRRNVLARLLLFAAFASTQAAPGDLDPTFGGTGSIRVGVGGGTDYANAIAQQGDGKFVVGGLIVDQALHPDGNSSCLLARYNTNGTLDTTFGTNGSVQTRIGTASSTQAILILSGGKILTAGYARNASNNYDFALAQYNSDGTLDASFGSNGILMTDFGGASDDLAYALVVQTDGKIIAAGKSASRYALARYSSAGVLDTTFNGTGRLVGPTVANSTFQVTAVTFVGTRIYFAGTKLSSSYSGFLTSLNANGSLNTAFNGTGSVTLGGSGDTQAGAITVLATIVGEEKILVAGSQVTQTVWSYDANNGLADTSFGGSGTGRASPFLALGLGTSIRIQTSLGSPSRILVGGAVNNDFLVSRFLIDGTVDTAFGAGDGFVFADVGGSDYATGLVVQSSDNKIVLAGLTKQPANAIDLGGDNDVAIARLNSNGTFDTTFSGDGKQMNDFGNANAGAVAVVLQPDGKIIAAGGKTVARFNPDGSFDPTFDFDGKAKINGGQIVRVALQSNGKIVLAATTTVAVSNFIVHRLNSDGSPDSTFSGDGVATISYASHTVEVSGLAIQADGYIVLGATTYAGTGQHAFSAARFLPDGTTDTSFGPSGTGFTNLVVFNGQSCNALLLQSDGKIILGGQGSISGEFRALVLRLLSNGNNDTNFRGGGAAPVPSGGNAYALALQPDGKILAGGSAGSSQVDFLASRLNTNGSDDTTFDGDGSAITPLGLFADVADGIALQADGKILLAGQANLDSTGNTLDLAVARYNADGSLDSSYGSGGKILLHSTYSTDAAHDIVIDSQGRAVLAGESGGIFVLARLQGGGSAASTVVSAVSRKTHGSSGTFDVPLPLTGTPGVECRSGASYQVLVNFAGTVSMNGFTVSGGASADSFTVTGSTATLNLTPTSSGGKRLLITLQNVNVGSTNGDVDIPMNILVGDVNGSGTVSASDIGQVKATSGQTISASNFRSDVNAGGTINATDIGQVKASSGSTLPAADGKF